MRLRIKSTKTTIKVIGIFQIVGGIIGLGMTSWLLMNTSTINGAVMFIFLLALFLFVFSIQSGNLLLQKPNLKKGLIYSCVIQALQVFHIGAGIYEFAFYSGARGTLGFKLGEGFNFNFAATLSGFNFTIKAGEPEYYFYINFVAVLVLITVVSIMQELKEKEKTIDIGDEVIPDDPASQA